MHDNMENVLNEYTNKVFKVVAECYANGRSSKAKPNVKELLRVVWQKSRTKTCLEVGSTFCSLSNKVIQNKGW